MSEEKVELFTALSEFQGELDNATKGSKGNYGNYADLAEVINSAKPFLEKYGLAVTQLMGSTDSGKATLTTMLTHKSGQYMYDTLVLVEAELQGGGGKNPAQKLGSAITYQRRYAYAAIVGLAQEDDDAESLTRKQQAKERASFNPDNCLNEATNAISKTTKGKDCKDLYGKYWSKLDRFREHQSKLQEYVNGHMSDLKAKAVKAAEEAAAKGE